MNMKPEEGHLTPIHPSLMSSMERGVEPPNLGKKKGKFGSKRGGSAAIPDYVHVPENVFTFSEKPYCSFHGHLDEVLDLSWSRSQVSDVKKSHIEPPPQSAGPPAIRFLIKPSTNSAGREGQLLSSSMDKTVRLWDLDTKT
ncbi:WD repeat-containing protein 44-like, partial [Trifolium medium]|nr:WD repeat-containing protein 44-like [Trifolium medium]